MNSSWQIVQPSGFGATLEDELLSELDSRERDKEDGDTEPLNSSEEEEEEDKDGEDEKDGPAWDYFCVLDFEAVRERVDDAWLYEVTELPVTLFNCRTRKVEDAFQRYCRPARVSAEVMERYLDRKYGKLGLAEKWNDAVGFGTALQDLEHWLEEKGLLPPSGGKEGTDFKFAFITCGDWDLKNMLPRNCHLLGIPVPYFMKQWINIKTVYQEFFQTRRPPSGMTTMLRALHIPLEGTHHVGKDDANNIAKIACKLLSDGCRFFITGREADMWHPGQHDAGEGENEETA